MPAELYSVFGMNGKRYRPIINYEITKLLN
jgi:hypothetical protein